MPFFENKGTEPWRDGFQTLAFPFEGKWAAAGVQSLVLIAAALWGCNPHCICALCSSLYVNKLWDLHGFLDYLAGGNLTFLHFSPYSGEGIKCKCVQVKKKRGRWRQK